MKRRSAIKNDLFAADERREKIDRLGDPLAEIESHIDFGVLTAEVDRIAPHPLFNSITRNLTLRSHARVNCPRISETVWFESRRHDGRRERVQKT